MEDDLNMLASKLVAVDLSKSSFRGSGAMYQTDRLTVGRTKTCFVEGKSEVIEKVVYKDNQETIDKVGDLECKLNESLMRLLVVSVDHKRLQSKIQQNRGNDQNHKLFENKLLFENQSLKSEVERLKQMLLDKEKEITVVRESEIRKSAIQAGDLTVRLTIMKQEMQRLQASNTQKNTQISNAMIETQKLREDVQRKNIEMANSHAVDELKYVLQEKEGVITSLQRQIENFKTDRSTSDQIHSLRAQLEQVNSQLRASEGSYQSLKQNLSQVYFYYQAQTTISELKSNLDHSNSNLKEAKDARMHYESRAQDLENALQQKESRISKLIEDLKRVK